MQVYMYNCIERILANSYKCEGFLGIYSKEISGQRYASKTMQSQMRLVYFLTGGSSFLYFVYI